MVKIDKKRFREIFREVFLAYTNKQGLFAKLRAENFGPQNIHRPNAVDIGSKDHLYWLSLVALSDKRTNSSVLYRCFARMFTDHPNLFVRRRYPSHPEMTKLFRAYTIALPVKEIAFFLERKKHLDEVFDGDPIMIFNDASDIDGLMKKLKVMGTERGIPKLFPGAAEKIFSLLAMFLSEFTELRFADVVPIDTWVQAVAISTRVVRGKGRIKDRAMESMLRPLMTELYAEFRHALGTSNATWILGKVACTRCASENMEGACPVYDKCKGPFWRLRHPVSDKHYGQFKIPPDYRCKGGSNH